MSQALQVVTRTWGRDTHGLFDFEEKEQNLQTKTFAVNSSSTCIRDGADVQMLSGHCVPPSGADPLLRLISRMGNFFVERGATSTNSKKKLWLVVRDSPEGSHKLSEGDIIKLGRFKFCVRQLASQATGCQPELPLDDSGAVRSADPDEMQSKVCRICLTEGAEDDNPLIAPCKCKGTIEFVHLGCLQRWTRGRINQSQNGSGSYIYKPQTCELCKEPLPAYAVVGDQKRPLVDVPPTLAPFVVLESMVRDASREFHVVSLADGKPLKVGRGHEADIRIADVSISRCHATIRFSDGQFLLEDNGSKFGTLVAMKRWRPLEAQTTVSIQAGRTVVSLTMQACPVDAAGGPEQLPHEVLYTSAIDERAARLALLMHREPGAGGRLDEATLDTSPPQPVEEVDDQESEHIAHI